MAVAETTPIDSFYPSAVRALSATAIEAGAAQSRNSANSVVHFAFFHDLGCEL